MSNATGTLSMRAHCDARPLSRKNRLLARTILKPGMLLLAATGLWLAGVQATAATPDTGDIIDPRVAEKSCCELWREYIDAIMQGITPPPVPQCAC